MKLFFLFLVTVVFWGCGSPEQVETAVLKFPNLFKESLKTRKPLCAKKLCYVNKIVAPEINKIISSLFSRSVLDEISDGFVSDYYRSVHPVISAKNNVFAFLTLSTSKRSCVLFKYILVGIGDSRRWIETIDEIEFIKIKNKHQLVPLETPAIWLYDQNIVQIAKSYKEFPRGNNPHEYINVAGSLCKELSEYQIASTTIDIFFSNENYPEISVLKVKSVSI